MRDQIITTETNKLAKAKGFDWKTCTCGGFPDCICTEDDINTSQSLLQKWAREEHNITIGIFRQPEHWEIMISQITPYSCILDSHIKYDTYEEALEAGLQEALKLIK